MPSLDILRSLRVLALILSCLAAVANLNAQGAKQSVPHAGIPESDADHDADRVKERAAWFFRGRLIPGKPSAELRHRAYQAKLQMRAQRALLADHPTGSIPWAPLGPVPLASDATGNGTQDYHQVEPGPFANTFLLYIVKNIGLT